MWPHLTALTRNLNKDNMDYLLVACDSIYLKEFGPAFVASAHKFKHNVLLFVVNPTEESMEILKKMEDHCTDSDFMWLSQSVDFTSFSDMQKRVYYASLRFLVLPDLIETSEIDNRFLVVDIDSIVMKPVPFPDVDLGLCTCDDWKTLAQNPIEVAGMKMSAGIVYATTESLDYFKMVKKFIVNQDFQYWFLDQQALNECVPDLTEFFDFKDTMYFDIDFIEDSYIWTGRGPRKYDNETYVKAFDEMTELFNG